VVSSIFSLLVFSSPILSRRMDIYHTYRHDMASVGIYNAGFKCSERGWLKYRTQKLPKIRHLRTIAQFCPVYLHK